ncbi:MAG: hypothetical protein RLZZ292_2427 [Bacteroidota bacterium]|jgi:hypothetical protein
MENKALSILLGEYSRASAIAEVLLEEHLATIAEKTGQSINVIREDYEKRIAAIQRANFEVFNSAVALE